jgi:hypothetical protein
MMASAMSWGTSQLTGTLKVGTDLLSSGISKSGNYIASKVSHEYNVHAPQIVDSSK